MATNLLNIYIVAVLGCVGLSLAFLLAWSFYYRIFLAQPKPPKWYHFWDQRSGAPGILLAVAIFLAFYGLLFYILLL